ncbi:VOC family protein [Streptomyces sp. NPDC008125]|uniref:VOC family protein n=1 Tax=Streptomyces sp. NPDC008125 TaxID=3364811 RepID=UPI0036EE5F97
MSAITGQRLPAPGIPCWVNLMVEDLPAVRAFYAAVLGWEFQPSPLGNQFLVAFADGAPVAVLGTRKPGFAPESEWTPYFVVRDAHTTAARVQERGATVAVGPVALGAGRAGLAADPEGATFGFWEGTVPAWTGESRVRSRVDLQTRNVFDAALFYGGVLGWAEEPGIDVAYQDDHVLVESEGTVALTFRGGGAPGSAEPHLRPRWLVNFSVDDVEAAVVAAVRAGGRRPRLPSTSWTPKGFSRTLQDPTGGLFTLTHRRP